MVSALLLPPRARRTPPAKTRRHDLIGFRGARCGGRLGALFTDRAAPPLAWLVGALPPARPLDRPAGAADAASPSRCRWRRRAAARFETLLSAWRTILRTGRAAAIPPSSCSTQAGRRLRRLADDALPAQSMAYAPAEVGVVNKVIGLWLTIGGAGRRRADARSACARSLGSSGCCRWPATRLLVAGGERQGRAAGPHDPGLRLGLVARQATPVDGGLLMVIAFENLSGGMGTAASGLPDEPVQPALHRHAVRAAVGLRPRWPGLQGGAAGWRAG